MFSVWETLIEYIGLKWSQFGILSLRTRTRTLIKTWSLSFSFSLAHVLYVDIDLFPFDSKSHRRANVNI